MFVYAQQTAGGQTRKIAKKGLGQAVTASNRVGSAAPVKKGLGARIKAGIGSVAKKIGLGK